MKFIENNVHLMGWLYQHKLEKKVTGAASKTPGTTYISGSIDVATNSEITNIVTVHYTYVTPTYGSTGKSNPTFATLSSIIDGKFKTVMGDGVDAAAKIKVDTSIALNEFYSDRDGEETLVSNMRNEGGFIHVLNTFEKGSDDAETAKKFNSFDMDIVISKFKRFDATEDKPERGIVHGFVFDFRKQALPVDFVVYKPKALDYFESFDYKQPLYTHISGEQASTTIIKKETFEGAFGDEEVRETKSTRREYVLTNSRKQTYVYNDTDDTDAEGITKKELEKLIADRELYLAGVKKRQDDYKASKVTTSNAAPATTAPKSGGFNF